MSFIIFAAFPLAWGVFSESGFLRGQSAGEPSQPETSPVFTPAHSSMGEAVRHFFGIRPEPVQPIEYPHKPHIEVASLQCEFCHSGVTRGPVAGIPGVTVCWGCHEFVGAESPEVQKIRDYHQRGQDIPWERVYGWHEEAHVHFNHAAHRRAGIECSTCHGDVAQMTVAERVVNHTMGFCVSCHTQSNASNDCIVCHY